MNSHDLATAGRSLGGLENASCLDIVNVPLRMNTITAG